jgi:hypothetical protein
MASITRPVKGMQRRDSPVRILLVKPSPRLGTIRGLQAFQRLEPLELGYLAAAAGPEHDIRVLDLRLRGFPRRASAARCIASSPTWSASPAIRTRSRRSAAWRG